MRAFVLVAAVAAAVTLAPSLRAQPSPDRANAMARLAFMRGTWVGPASGFNADRSRYEVTQTERVGPMLGGDILVIEGRGYAEGGSTAFNAFAVVSWTPATGKHEMRSYARGYAGTFELTPTEDGFQWQVPAGGEAIIRYTATIKDGTWREIGERIAPGQPTVQIFEMNLKRTGDTDWPEGTPVSPTDAASPVEAAPAPQK